MKLPHVTMRKNRDGSYRYYFRRRGYPLQRLPEDPISAEFMDVYKRMAESAAPLGQATEGTFGWLCDQYMDSSEFTQKAKATQAARRRIIISMMREPIVRGYPEAFAVEHLKNIDQRHITVLRDRKAENPNAANERLKILSQIFKLAIARKWRTDNPVRDVPRLSVPKGGHRTATDADLAKYEARHRSGPARRAMVLLKAFGMRVSDLRIIGPQHVKNGLLIFETVKTGAKCELEMTREVVQEVADCRDLVFMMTESGKPFASDKALSQRIAKWFRQAGVEGVTAHSVRKWCATRAADNGATEYEMMAYFGWKDPKEARPYVQNASRRRLAASLSAKIRSVTAG